MAIMRRTSPGALALSQQYAAHANPLIQYVMQLPLQRKLRLMDSIKKFYQANYQKEQAKKAADEGGGALGTGIGAGAGAILGAVLAPFTAGTSLALTAASGASLGAGLGGTAGGLIGEAVSPAGSPEAAAASRAKSQSIRSLVPLAGGLAGGFGAMANPPTETVEKTEPIGTQIDPDTGDPIGTMTETTTEEQQVANPFMHGFTGTIDKMQKFALQNPYLSKLLPFPTDLVMLPSAKLGYDDEEDEGGDQ